MSGKGSKPRPQTVAHEEFAANYQTIFGETRLQRLAREQALAKLAAQAQLQGLYEEPSPLVPMYDTAAAVPVQEMSEEFRAGLAAAMLTWQVVPS